MLLRIPHCEVREAQSKFKKAPAVREDSLLCWILQILGLWLPSFTNTITATSVAAVCKKGTAYPTLLSAVKERFLHLLLLSPPLCTSVPFKLRSCRAALHKALGRSAWHNLERHVPGSSAMTYDTIALRSEIRQGSHTAAKEVCT